MNKGFAFQRDDVVVCRWEGTSGYTVVLYTDIRRGDVFRVRLGGIFVNPITFALDENTWALALSDPLYQEVFLRYGIEVEIDSSKTSRWLAKYDLPRRNGVIMIERNPDV